MTQQLLGQSAAARATLVRLRETLQKKPGLASYDEMKAFLREATELVEGAAATP
jgi:hypothetical protein